MCDYFDDFDWEFMYDDFSEDDYDDAMEDSVDPDFNDDPNQENDQSDGFDWDEAYWSGVGIGFSYEEGRRKR